MHPSESDEILSALAEKEKDIAYSRNKVESLLLKGQNTRALITSLLERLNGYNLEKQMLALQSLQQQAQDENAIMRGLAEQGSRDSTSVKILTLLMLVHLPCTVVSGFYSTQFVDQDISSAGNKQLKYADNMWMFFAVSIPLTLGTVMVWVVWLNLKIVGRKLSEMQQEWREKMRECVRSFGLFGKGSGLPT